MTLFQGKYLWIWVGYVPSHAILRVYVPWNLFKESQYSLTQFEEITFLGNFSEHVLMDTFPSNVIKHAFTVGIL